MTAGAAAAATVSVTIVGGAGGIGSSVAFNLLRTSTPYDIVIVDTRENMVTSHVMDLGDLVALGGAHSIRGGTAADALTSDIVVISAAVPLRLNTDRRVFVAENAAVLATIVDPLAAAGWNGVLLIMTNPVDALLTWVQKRTGFARERVLGYTLNDSLRFRTGIAAALGVAPQSVDAWVLGEHGLGQLPLWNRITVDGRRVELSAEQRVSVSDYIDNWYTRHVALDSGRTSTWSSGRGGALMIEEIVHGSANVDGTPAPFPAAVVLQGEYGITGASSGVPAILGPRGLRGIVQWPLTDEEHAQLAESAGRIAELAAGIPA